MELIKDKIKNKKNTLKNIQNDVDPLNIKIFFLLYLDSGELFISPLYAKGILALQYQDYSAFYGMMPVDYENFPAWIINRCDFFNLKKPFEHLDKYINQLNNRIKPEEGDIFCQLFLEEYCQNNQDVAYGFFTPENTFTINYTLLNSGFLKTQSESLQYINNIVNLCTNTNIFYPFKMRINQYA